VHLANDLVELAHHLARHAAALVQGEGQRLVEGRGASHQPLRLGNLFFEGFRVGLGRLFSVNSLTLMATSVWAMPSMKLAAGLLPFVLLHRQDLARLMLHGVFAGELTPSTAWCGVLALPEAGLRRLTLEDAPFQVSGRGHHFHRAPPQRLLT